LQKKKKGNIGNKYIKVLTDGGEILRNFNFLLSTYLVLSFKFWSQHRGKSEAMRHMSYSRNFKDY
jgi:hypothetical protein